MFDLAMLGLFMPIDVAFPSEHLFALITREEKTFFVDGFDVGIEVSVPILEGSCLTNVF